LGKGAYYWKGKAMFVWCMEGTMYHIRDFVGVCSQSKKEKVSHGYT
jgi:hypothetical protein